MRNIKLILEYDGSAFYGFQKQPDHPTIQEALEKALSRLLNQPIKIKSASGRTDTGVHAEAQVVNFTTAHPMPLQPMQRGLNALLPPAVAVKKIEEMPGDFHARFSARSKVYEYRIWNDPVRSPLQAGRVYQVPEKMNVVAMRRAAAYLCGRHDFKSFCASSPCRKVAKKNTTRTVHRLRLACRGPLIRIRIEADGFLYHMVRNIVGTLIETGKGKIPLKDIRRILLAKDRCKAGATAPAHGLTLIRVNYPFPKRGGSKK